MNGNPNPEGKIMNEPRAVLVIGAGDATGGAIAKRFAREGYIACVTRRQADKLQPLVDQIRADGGRAMGFASDARDEAAAVAPAAGLCTLRRRGVQRALGAGRCAGLIRSASRRAKGSAIDHELPEALGRPWQG
jgi:NAD(P)-dependent dehydrogenase (short-subunit alcohol dehydrogenase family)